MTDEISSAARVRPVPSSLQDPDSLAGKIESLTLADGAEAVPHPKGRHLQLMLDGDSLRWPDLIGILEADSVEVTLASVARARMIRSREGALRSLRSPSNTQVYGWNRALGPLKDHQLTDAEQKQFQINVLKSHAAGIGEYLSAPIARLALIIRANTLARATTGVRPELVDRILSVLNAGIVPLMPEIGSLGTGDLQPMAAAGLCLIGEQIPAADRTGITTASEALRHSGLAQTFTLEAGEAIALISGSAVLSACLAAATVRVERQLGTFVGAFALFCEATRAEQQTFDPRLHIERRIPLEELANAHIRRLIDDSEWMTPAGRQRLGELTPRVQDSTSVRATPHKVTSVLHALQQTKQQLTWEVNASTANPLVLPNGNGDYEFVAGGNWDCSVLGHSTHSLNVHVTDIAVLSKDLASRLGSDAWSYGLPPSLSGGKAGLNSGMTLVHAVGASLIPEMHARSTPVSSLSFPIKGGQEDHNTMAMASVRNLVSNLDRFDVVLAVLVLMSAQGIDLIAPAMKNLRLGTGSHRIHTTIRKRIAPLQEDRYMTDEIKVMTEMVRSAQLNRLPQTEFP
jgi:histidine ammonia-lyase